MFEYEVVVRWRVGSRTMEHSRWRFESLHEARLHLEELRSYQARHGCRIFPLRPTPTEATDTECTFVHGFHVPSLAGRPLVSADLLIRRRRKQQPAEAPGLAERSPYQGAQSRLPEWKLVP